MQVNFLPHLYEFGINPLLVSGLGNDTLGKKIASALSRFSLPSSGITFSDRYPTGTVTVSIAHIDVPKDLPHSIPLLYHGSLTLRNQESRETHDVLKQRAKKTFVAINIRKPWFDDALFSTYYKIVAWLKINRDELGILIHNNNLHTSDLLKATGRNQEAAPSTLN